MYAKAGSFLLVLLLIKNDCTQIFLISSASLSYDEGDIVYLGAKQLDQRA